MEELDEKDPVLELDAKIQLIRPAIRIELCSMDEMRAVALLLSRPIIHNVSSYSESGYYVFDGSTLYRCAP